MAYGLNPSMTSGFGLNFSGKSTLLGGDVSAPTTGANTGSATMLSNVGGVLAIAGAINGAIGSYYAAQNQKYQLDSQASSMQFQSSMSQINARQAEFTAQNILLAGERQIGQLTMRAGKIKSATRAAMAANGVVLNEGSAAEVQGTQDLMKEIDTLTINSNTVRAAEAARTQKVNYQNQSLMQGVSANNLTTSSNTISPGLAASTSLLGSAASVANTWASDYKLKALLARANLD